MSDPDTPDPAETVNRESQPNAAGPERLAGDMGISSERTDGFEGDEGTGTAASSQGATDGQAPTVRDEDGERIPAAADPDIDRTGGEVQPDEVAHKHPFDPKRNPGH